MILKGWLRGIENTGKAIWYKAIDLVMNFFKK